jgi:hypothetical protein
MRWYAGRMRLRVSTSVAPLALALASGCTPEAWTEVRVREPAAASVEIDTPHGRQVVLPPGREPAENTLPRTMPPYGPDALYEASAIREESGAVTMRCDACPQAPLARVVPGGADVLLTTRTLRNDGPVTVRWERDALRMSFAYPYYVHGGRHLQGPYTAFRYDVVLPKDAVVEVREKREDLHAPGWVVLAAGVGVTALSVLLLDLGAKGFHGKSASAESILGFSAGAALATPALILDFVALGLLLAPGPYDRRLEAP